MSSQRLNTPIEQRRAERELFFWTAFQTLRLIAAGAFVVAYIAYVAISLIEGRLPGGDLLLRALGAG